MDGPYPNLPAPMTGPAREQGVSVPPLSSELQTQLDRLSDGKGQRVRDVQSRKTT
jgi:hypothetical protein